MEYIWEVFNEKKKSGAYSGQEEEYVWRPPSDKDQSVFRELKEVSVTLPHC